MLFWQLPEFSLRYSCIVSVQSLSCVHIDTKEEEGEMRQKKRKGKSFYSFFVKWFGYPLSTNRNKGTGDLKETSKALDGEDVLLLEHVEHAAN